MDSDTLEYFAIAWQNIGTGRHVVVLLELDTYGAQRLETFSRFSVFPGTFCLVAATDHLGDIAFDTTRRIDPDRPPCPFLAAFLFYAHPVGVLEAYVVSPSVEETSRRILQNPKLKAIEVVEHPNKPPEPVRLFKHGCANGFDFTAIWDPKDERCHTPRGGRRLWRPPPVINV